MYFFDGWASIYNTQTTKKEFNTSMQINQQDRVAKVFAWRVIDYWDGLSTFINKRRFI